MQDGARDPDEVPGPVDGTEAGVTREVQEHLGQRLRSTYNEATGNPTYLGDSALPEPFDTHLRRIEAVETRQREEVRRRGLEAVEKALADLGAEPVTDERD